MNKARYIELHDVFTPLLYMRSEDIRLFIHTCIHKHDMTNTELLGLRNELYMSKIENNIEIAKRIDVYLNDVYDGLIDHLLRFKFQ